MKIYIAVTDKQRQLIIDAFKITPRMVRYALSYDSDTNLAKRIRKLALEAGGVRMVTVAEIECIFDSYGNMTQLMPNGAVIEISKETGDAKVFMKGKLKIHVDDIRIREIGALQKAASELK